MSPHFVTFASLGKSWNARIMNSGDTLCSKTSKWFQRFSKVHFLSKFASQFLPFLRKIHRICMEFSITNEGIDKMDTNQEFLNQYSTNKGVEIDIKKFKKIIQKNNNSKTFFFSWFFHFKITKWQRIPEVSVVQQSRNSRDHELWNHEMWGSPVL